MFFLFFFMCRHKYFPLGDKNLLYELLPELIKFHLKVKKTNFDPIQGLYYNTDNRDGMEASIGILNYNM